MIKLEFKYIFGNRFYELHNIVFRVCYTRITDYQNISNFSSKEFSFLNWKSNDYNIYSLS